MSAYFQRLLRQSGVQLSAPPALAVSAPPAPGPAHTVVPASRAHDLIEVHEERVMPPATAAASSHPVVASVPFSSSPPAVAAGQTAPAAIPPLSATSDRSAERVVIQKTDTVETEIISLEPASRGPRSSPLSSSSLSPAGPTHPTAEPAVAKASANPELPAEIMQAVMKWIAAGSAPTTAPAPSAHAPSSEDRPEKTAAKSSAAPAAPPTPREAPKIPGRVIQIVEEHFEDAAPPPRAASGAAPSPAAGKPSPAFVSPPENPVSVSIGSIQVRIDAPAPPPARVVRPAPPARPTAPASRSSGISQLRRHYIIPH